ncbi:MAG: response regulator [Desulfobacterales bacterium]|jgi:DNA-binding NtrC family response regulator
MAEMILVIDDEADMLMMLRMLIEDNTGCRVETTNTPSEGLKRLSEEPFDLVITDLKMPGMDGLELFSEIKKIAPRLPVILITAYGSQEIADEAVREGITDFITKPFKKDRILFSIVRSLELARLRNENEELRGKMSKSLRADGTG